MTHSLNQSEIMTRSMLVAKCETHPELVGKVVSVLDFVDGRDVRILKIAVPDLGHYTVAAGIYPNVEFITGSLV